MLTGGGVCRRGMVVLRVSPSAERAVAFQTAAVSIMAIDQRRVQVEDLP